MWAVELNLEGKFRLGETKMKFELLIIMISGNTALSESQLSLEDSAGLHCFNFFGFSNSNSCLQRKATSLVSNPPTWRYRSLYLWPPVTGWTSYTPRHRIPLSSPSVTSSATIYCGGILTRTRDAWGFQNVEKRHRHLSCRSRILPDDEGTMLVSY
jgi:hypothetical protein